MSIRSAYDLHSSVSSPSFVAGMECEIENIYSADVPSSMWKITEDPSLRNNGREFITTEPKDKAGLINDFVFLHEHLKFGSSVDPFTDRTSTHVHVNCLDLEEGQVKSITLFYALFEAVFFKLVNPERANNIYCVALSQTILPESYRRPLSVLVQSWSKYTALNLLPLRSLGTIEFRHMEGTNDKEKIAEWLTVLENLWNFGKNTPLDKKWLNKPGNIESAYKAIFKGTKAEEWLPYMPGMIQDSLIDIKLAFH